MRVDADRAAAAVDRIARRLKLDRTAAAAGILRVANSNMERAIRVVSVERGYDPREFALVAFGGCGGLHACEIAERVGNSHGDRAAICRSALRVGHADGRCRARLRRRRARPRPTSKSVLTALETRARRESPECADRALRRPALSRPELRAQRSLELGRVTRTAFHREHARIYGYSLPEREVEVVTIRVRARVTSPKPRIVRPSDAKGRRRGPASLDPGSWRRIPVWNREQLAKTPLSGPALVLDYGSTTLVPPGWRFHVDQRRQSADPALRNRRSVYTKSSHMRQKIRSTTILCVRRDGKVVMAGDGQVTLGSEVLKSSAKKLRRLYNRQDSGRIRGLHRGRVRAVRPLRSQARAA